MKIGFTGIGNVGAHAAGDPLLCAIQLDTFPRRLHRDLGTLVSFTP